MNNINQQRNKANTLLQNNTFLVEKEQQGEELYEAFYNLSTQDEQLSHHNVQSQEISNDFEGNGQNRQLSPITKKKLQKKTTQRRKGGKVNKKKVKRVKEFNLEEDQRLLSSILQYGRQFSRLVKLFPKRTVSMLKNRYYKNLQFRWFELMGIDYENEYEYKNESDTSKEVEESYEHQPVDCKSLISILPQTYKCPIIQQLLKGLIVNMDCLLKQEV